MDVIIFYPMSMKHEAADATLAVSGSAQSKSKYMAGPEAIIMPIYETLSFISLIHLQLETVQTKRTYASAMV